MGWYEREEEQLENELANGEISNKEFNAAIRDMRREQEENAQQSAREAYDREMNQY